MYKKNENIILRKIHDSIFLIDITDNYLDSNCSLYEINEIGEFIWNALGNGSTLGEIVKLLLKNIVDEVDECEVAEDVENYILMLVSEGFVLEVKQQ